LVPRKNQSINESLTRSEQEGAVPVLYHTPTTPTAVCIEPKLGNAGTTVYYYFLEEILGIPNHFFKKPFLPISFFSLVVRLKEERWMDTAHADLILRNCVKGLLFPVSTIGTTFSLLLDREALLLLLLARTRGRQGL
jgi:hypothetical protein